MTTDILSAGDEIDSRCLKCKDLTNHTIIAMVENTIAKVQCNVCKGRHNYRPAAIVKAKTTVTKRKSPTGTTTKRSTTAQVKKAAANYEKAIEGRSEGESKAYAMTATFTNNDMIDHPTFGTGVVTNTIPPNKIEVTFTEGPKILVCTLD